MNFFSSEEHVKEWVQSNPELKGDIITMKQALALITPIAAKRLDYDYVRPGGAEMVKIMEAAGLVNDFWRPR